MNSDLSVLIAHDATEVLHQAMSTEITKRRHDTMMNDYSAYSTTEHLQAGLNDLDMVNDEREDDHIVIGNQELEVEP